MCVNKFGDTMDLPPMTRVLLDILKIKNKNIVNRFGKKPSVHRPFKILGIEALHCC